MWLLFTCSLHSQNHFIHTHSITSSSISHDVSYLWQKLDSSFFMYQLSARPQLLASLMFDWTFMGPKWRWCQVISRTKPWSTWMISWWTLAYMGQRPCELRTWILSGRWMAHRLAMGFSQDYELCVGAAENPSRCNWSEWEPNVLFLPSLRRCSWEMKNQTATPLCLLACWYSMVFCWVLGDESTGFQPWPPLTNHNLLPNTCWKSQCKSSITMQHPWRNMRSPGPAERMQNLMTSLIIPPISQSLTSLPSCLNLTLPKILTCKMIKPIKTYVCWHATFFMLMNYCMQSATGTMVTSKTSLEIPWWCSGVLAWTTTVQSFSILFSTWKWFGDNFKQGNICTMVVYLANTLHFLQEYHVRLHACELIGSCWPLDHYWYEYKTLDLISQGALKQGLELHAFFIMLLVLVHSKGPLCFLRSSWQCLH